MFNYPTFDVDYLLYSALLQLKKERKTKIS